MTPTTTNTTTTTHPNTNPTTTSAPTRPTKNDSHQHRRTHDHAPRTDTHEPHHHGTRPRDTKPKGPRNTNWTRGVTETGNRKGTPGMGEHAFHFFKAVLPLFFGWCSWFPVFASTTRASCFVFRGLVVWVGERRGVGRLGILPLFGVEPFLNAPSALSSRVSQRQRCERNPSAPRLRDLSSSRARMDVGRGGC